MPCDYSQLAHPGIMKLHPYEAGKTIESLRRELGLSEIIKLASNENPLGASPLAIEAAKKALASLSLYPESHDFDLREALSEFHQIDPLRILMGNGSDALLSLIVQAFVSPHQEVIISEHGFATFSIVTYAHQAEPVIIPAKEWGHDLIAMADAVTEKTRLIFLANPNNPTATWFTERELIGLLKKVPPQVLVVVDEAYVEFAQHPSYPDTLQLQKTYDNLIMTRTFSKAYGLAGLRLGYMVSTKECVNLLQRIRLPFTINRVVEAAAIAALKDQEHIDKTVANNQKGHAQLQVAFRQMGLDALPSVCNFITVNMMQNALPIYHELLKRGIIVRPLLAYNLPQHFRITIGTEEENARLIDALEKILKKECVT